MQLNAFDRFVKLLGREKAEEVLQFIKRLKERTSIEILQVDERFTSVMAQRSILAMGTSKKGDCL